MPSVGGALGLIRKESADCLNDDTQATAAVELCAVVAKCREPVRLLFGRDHEWQLPGKSASPPGRTELTGQDSFRRRASLTVCDGKMRSSWSIVLAILRSFSGRPFRCGGRLLGDRLGAELGLLRAGLGWKGTAVVRLKCRPTLVVPLTAWLSGFG